MSASTEEESCSIVRVCSFNLRRADLDQGTPNAWEKRRPIVKQCLEKMQPTIIGSQECCPAQLKDVLNDLNE